MAAEAVVRVAFPGRPKVFDYLVPSGSDDREIDLGVAVKVPLRARTVFGYVVDRRAIDGGESEVPSGAPDASQLRCVLGVDHSRPRLPAELVALLNFAAGYYATSLGDMLRAMLPPAVRDSAPRYRLVPGADVGPSGQQVLFDGRDGELRERLLGALGRARVGADVATLARRVGAERRAVATLLRQFLKAGLAVQGVAVPVNTQVNGKAVVAQDDELPVLSPDQLAVVDAAGASMSKGQFGAFLLEGVTGSGKTEVYMRLIERALVAGRTALVLVPEIALTPQLSGRFEARFGDRVATFHSGLTAAQRSAQWRRVYDGEVQIGVGARSAVFLPLRDPGVLVVDEEHEGCFKQDESPRYNARDLAVFRARQNGAVVVLGTATPSMESYQNANTRRYSRLSLPNRISGRPLPKVELVPMADCDVVGEGLLSEPLASAIEGSLDRGEQVILLLNRRGFAPYVFCRDCGDPFKCAECAVALTLHRGADELLCHYCGHSEPVPRQCAECKTDNIGNLGVGTERLSEELSLLFGGAAVARFDRDTVRRRDELERGLKRFRRGETQILVGTQMVAKGHDFPRVSTVGVLSADSSLNLPDFRAAEKTFQLLTQVAGRAGRGDIPGRVFVQVYERGHFAVECAAEHDVARFMRQELENRRELFYPPFARLWLFRLEGEDEPAARAAALSLAKRLREWAGEREGVWILGPAPAPLKRLRRFFRFQVLVKAKNRDVLHGLLAVCQMEHGAGVRQILDVDPVSML